MIVFCAVRVNHEAEVLYTFLVCMLCLAQLWYGLDETTRSCEVTVICFVRHCVQNTPSCQS